MRRESHTLEVIALRLCRERARNSSASRVSCVWRLRQPAVALCAFAALLLLPQPLHAQTPAPALTGNESLDFVQGPVVGSGRIVGLGGAYTALAVGADGAAWNPASYATRNLWDLDWFQWDVAFDYSLGAFRHTDFDNNGKTGAASNNNFLTLGLRTGFGPFGIGGLLRLQYYSLAQGAQLQLAVGNYGVAYAFLDGQLVIGLAARTAALTITDHAGSTLVDFAGTGPEAGAILGPEGQQFRIGVSARLAVHADRGTRAAVAAGLILPRELVLPAELQVGFAYQLGRRPLNRRYVNPHQFNRDLRRAMLAKREARQREQLEREAQGQRFMHSTDTAPPIQSPTASAAADMDAASHGDATRQPTDPEWLSEETRTRELENKELTSAIDAADLARAGEVKSLSRRYILLSSEAIVLGTVDNGIGVESFLTPPQRRQDSGRTLSLGMRVGAEGEPVQGRVKLRLGSYLEPSRFAGIGYRPHATLATDLRLFAWDLFGLLDEFELRVGAYADFAARYSSIGFGIGLWH